MTDHTAEAALLYVIKQRGPLKPKQNLALNAIKDEFWRTRDLWWAFDVQLPWLYRAYEIAKAVLPGCASLFSTALVDRIERTVINDPALEFDIQIKASEFFEWWWTQHPEWEWAEPTDEEIHAAYTGAFGVQPEQLMLF
jgi:hypothetical protein